MLGQHWGDSGLPLASVFQQVPWYRPCPFVFQGLCDFSAVSGQGWGPGDPPREARGFLEVPLPSRKSDSAGLKMADCDALLSHAWPWLLLPSHFLEPGRKLGAALVGCWVRRVLYFCSPKHQGLSPHSTSPAYPSPPQPPRIAALKPGPSCRDIHPSVPPTTPSPWRQRYPQGLFRCPSSSLAIVLSLRVWKGDGEFHDSSPAPELGRKAVS